MVEKWLSQYLFAVAKGKGTVAFQDRQLIAQKQRMVRIVCGQSNAVALRSH